MRNVLYPLIFFTLISLFSCSGSNSQGTNNESEYDEDKIWHGIFYRTQEDDYIRYVGDDGKVYRLNPKDGNYEGKVFKVNGTKYIIIDGWPEIYHRKNKKKSRKVSQEYNDEEFDYEYDDNDYEYEEETNINTRQTTTTSTQHIQQPMRQRVERIQVPCTAYGCEGGTKFCTYCGGDGYYEHGRCNWCVNGRQTCSVCNGRGYRWEERIVNY